MSWRAGLIVAHRWLGLAAGLVVAFVALTGAAYAFEAQLRRALGERIAPASVDARVGPSTLVANAQAVHPGSTFLWLMWSARLDEPVWVKVRLPSGRDTSVMLDPYSGAFLPEATRWRGHCDTLLHLHRTLGLGEPGKVLVGTAALVLGVLLVTGVAIALPRTLRRWWSHLAIPRGARGAAAAYGWHRALGWWVAPIATVSALTGLVWAFDWTRGVIDAVTRSAPLPPPPSVAEHVGTPLDLDVVLARARVLAGDAAHLRIYARRSDAAAWRVEWMPPEARFISQRSRSFIHPGTGEILQHLPYAATPRGERVSRLAYPIHTGLILGWPTQLLMFVGALGLAAVTGTGVWLFAARLRRSNASHQAAPAVANQLPT